MALVTVTFDMEDGTPGALVPPGTFFATTNVQYTDTEAIGSLSLGGAEEVTFAEIRQYFQLEGEPAPGSGEVAYTSLYTLWEEQGQGAYPVYQDFLDLVLEAFGSEQAYLDLYNEAVAGGGPTYYQAPIYAVSQRSLVSGTEPFSIAEISPLFIDVVAPSDNLIDNNLYDSAHFRRYEIVLSYNIGDDGPTYAPHFSFNSYIDDEYTVESNPVLMPFDEWTYFSFDLKGLTLTATVRNAAGELLVQRVWDLAGMDDPAIAATSHNVTGGGFPAYWYVDNMSWTYMTRDPEPVIASKLKSTRRRFMRI